VSAVCGPVWTQFAPQLQDLDAATVPTRVPLPSLDAGAIDASAADVPRDVVSLDAGAEDRESPDGGANADVPAPFLDRGVSDDLARATDLGLRDIAAPRDVVVPPSDAGGGRGRGACDCHAGATARPPAWLSLGLLGLAARRRRRAITRR
jgi:MYXO-CTERM domain-containing protein